MSSNANVWKNSTEKNRNEIKLTWTFHIHKIGIRTLNKTFFLVSPPFHLRSGMQQIFCELT